MKTFSRMMLLAISLLSICVALVAFSPARGGEGFEIYLDNKLVVQCFGSQMDKKQSLQLDPQSPYERLIVKYYHCGRAGKNRQITIMDEQEKILKKWHYSDVTRPSTGMDCRLKDIFELKNGHGSLKLYYSSTELPKGRLLASLLTNKGKPASIPVR